MSSYSSTLLVTALKRSFTYLVSLDVPPIASIRFTVRRDKGHVIGLEVFIQIRRAEQKQGNLIRIPKTLVKRADNTIKKFDSSK